MLQGHPLSPANEATMYHHVKKLMFTVRVDEPDPRFGNMLLEQFGGANGELAAAMQYSIQALWTAVQQKLPVIIIVLRNGDYSALKSFCDFTQVGREVPGMDIPGIDFVKIAQGYGMDGQEIDRPEDLESALKQACAASEPRVISVNLMPSTGKCMGMDQSVNPPNYR